MKIQLNLNLKEIFVHCNESTPAECTVHRIYIENKRKKTKQTEEKLFLEIKKNGNHVSTHYDSK